MRSGGDLLALPLEQIERVRPVFVVAGRAPEIAGGVQAIGRADPGGRDPEDRLVGLRVSAPSGGPEEDGGAVDLACEGRRFLESTETEERVRGAFPLAQIPVAPEGHAEPALGLGRTPVLTADVRVRERASRRDVWCVANGWLYSYRFAAEHAKVSRR